MNGMREILPDATTRAEIARSGKDRLVGSFKVCISADGKITAVNQLKSTGFPAYDQAIVSEVRASWSFRPFMVNGQPAPVCAAETFIFKVPPPRP